MLLALFALLSPANAQQTWTDTFSDNDISDWTNVDANVSVSGGVVRYNSTSHTGADLIINPGMDGTESEYTVETRGAADHGMGLTLSYSSSGSSCGFFIYSGATLYKWNPSTIETSIATISYTTGPSTFHDLKAEVSYKNVDIYLNGTQIYSGDIGCSDLTPTGEIGFGVHSGSEQYADSITVSWPHDDADGDGYTEDTGDCDDTNAAVNPAATEMCDTLDNDCDGTVDEDSAADATVWYADSDSDTYGDSASSDIDCYQPSGYVADATDCDDTNAAVNPAATEICDTLDNNCDGTVDEDSSTDVKTWYADSDSDTYGNAANTDIDCYQPSGYVADATDCDDTNGTTYPGADEYCDGHDDDCDGDIDEDASVDVSTWYVDSDSDGYGDSSSMDIDCYAPTGYVADSTDCDDTESTTYPGADEYCDGHDDDCDGDIDEDESVDVLTWYADSDSDGEGDPAASDIDCYQPTGYVENSTDCDDTTIVLSTADVDADGFTSCDSDCNDTDATINIDATEIWYDGVDQNCDEWSDYDQDGDGFEHLDYDADGDGIFGTDCDDEDAAVNIDATEIWYDGTDQDCDTLSDYDSDYDGQDSETYGGEDCNDADPNTYTGAPDTPYDGIITDCSNANDNDADGDGVLAMDHGGTDCDDANADINPNAEEVWYDGVDQDCDGNDDDQDGDGFNVDNDCDDTNADLAEDCSADTGDTGGGSDTGLDYDTLDKDSGGCFNSATGGTPAGRWALFLTGLVLIRRKLRVTA